MRRSSLLLLCAVALPTVAAQPVVGGLPELPAPPTPPTPPATPGPPTQEWQQVRPGLELSFPEDHGAHPDHRTEWWYLTGQLAAADGRRFGFQFTIFRSGLQNSSPGSGSSPLRARQVLLGHFALTDIAGDRTLFAERLRRSGSGLARAETGDMGLVLEDWSLVRGPGDRLTVSARDSARGMGLELELSPTKPLVLHGEQGYSSKGQDPGNASAYSSWTRLAASGRMVLDGTELDVTGESWFDHEYGSSVLEPGVVGWDWFGLQLADGRELMLFLLRKEDGSHAPASAGTLVQLDGSTRSLGAAEFEIEPQASWTSPRTSAVYPAGWRVRIPDLELSFEVRPVVSDCELTTARSTGVAYWEGPVELLGDVQGRGYAELTGYAGSMEGRF